MLAVIIAICFLAGLAWLAWKENKKLTQSGKILQRDARFFQKKEIFLTLAEYDDVVKKLRNEDYSGMKINVSRAEQIDAIVFETAYWKAVLSYEGPNMGRNMYEFMFVSWETRNGLARDGTGMNVIMTKIEKMFLSLDHETLARFEEFEISSKNNFF